MHEASCPYREARQLPRELKGHCQIFLEEQLCACLPHPCYIMGSQYDCADMLADTCAINLLNSTLASGVSRTTSSLRPAAVPPPSHLALLNTLLVHPLHTTRAENAEQREVSALSLDYLRNLLTLVGPVNAGFREAFQFHQLPRWTRRSGHTSPHSDSGLSDADSDAADNDRLRGRMANQSSIWQRGQDLWTTVGWALNTSTLYPHRWRQWKIWIEFMLDVIELDWAERERQDLDAFAANGKDGEVPLSARQESMIVMYMEHNIDRQSASRRIVKALFADGGSLASSLFPEVFEKEPRGPKKESKKRKRDQTLDLENGKFGDYFDDDSISSGVSEPPTPQRARDKRRESFAAANPGFVESVLLRLRFFKAVSTATTTLRKRSELYRLYEEFAAAVKGLPLEIFSLYVTQKQNPLPPEAHITLAKELFHLLLPSNYKDPRKVDSKGDAEGRLTSPMLEHCYVLSAANTVSLEDNAKLSLLVEYSMQLLWLCGVLEWTGSFADACEQGIQAREAKAKKKRTGKLRADSSDVLAHDVLASSADRIHILLRLLKVASDAA